MSLAFSLAVVSNIHTAVATIWHLVLSSVITGDVQVQRDQGTFKGSGSLWSQSEESGRCPRLYK